MKVKSDKYVFPVVGTTEAQKYFVNEVLLPKMKAAGMIERAHISDLTRWAIDRGAKEVGVLIETPTVERQKAGRKKKTEVVLM